MALTVLESVSDPGQPSSPNEDVAGHGARSAWVLDGATGLADGRLLPGPSDAAWLAALYDALLRDRADGTEAALGRLFGELIAEAARAFDASRLREPRRGFELPSAGMAFVRLAGGRLEYARLGDCRAILGLPDGRTVSTRRSTLHRLDSRVTGKMQALRRRGLAGGYAEARRAVQDDLRANRDLLNRPGGYWALGLDPEAARRMEVGAVAAAPGAPIAGLLVSDGFYRLVDTFGACRDDAALLSEARARGLATMLAELRGLEDADPECVSHPRLKPKDDATALLFEAVP